MTVTVMHGDCRIARGLAPGSITCIVTSPPYWGAIRYYEDGGSYGSQVPIGTETLPEAYADSIANVFRDLRPALHDEGSIWLNVGDVYAAGGRGGGGKAATRANWAGVRERKGFRMPPPGYKQKDLTLVAFQVADRMRRDGWYLRSTVIWQKPSAVEPMRRDRPAVSHEYLFLFSKSETYCVRNPGESWWGHSVWKIPAEPADGHPATMPTELARRCIVSSSSEGDTILDPFAGSGTTGVAADRERRHALLIEANIHFWKIANRRVGGDCPLLTEVA